MTMTETNGHKLVHNGSGQGACTCGEDLGHFPTDNDMINAFEIHALDNPGLIALAKALDEAFEEAEDDGLNFIDGFKLIAKKIEEAGWKYAG